MALGGSTLARKWRLEINTGTLISSYPGTGALWTIVYGRTDFAFSRAPGMQDDTDYDSGGFGSQTKTAETWSASGKLSRKTVVGAPTTYDPGQEFLRVAAQQFGAANSVQVRVYEINSGGPAVEAYWGQCAAGWTEDGGANDALATVSFTLAGQGALTSITHPLLAGAAAPTTSSVSPTSTGVAGGALITLTGAGFSGATALNISGTPLATSQWAVQSDTKIVFVAPAKTAGSYPITVTTPAGTSSGTSLTFA